MAVVACEYCGQVIGDNTKIPILVEVTVTEVRFHSDPGTGSGMSLAHVHTKPVIEPDPPAADPGPQLPPGPPPPDTTQIPAQPETILVTMPDGSQYPLLAS